MCSIILNSSPLLPQEEKEDWLRNYKAPLKVKEYQILLHSSVISAFKNIASDGNLLQSLTSLPSWGHCCAYHCCSQAHFLLLNRTAC